MCLFVHHRDELTDGGITTGVGVAGKYSIARVWRVLSSGGENGFGLAYPNFPALAALLFSPAAVTRQGKGHEQGR